VTADKGSVAERAAPQTTREIGRVHFRSSRDRHFDRQPALRDRQPRLDVKRGASMLRLRSNWMVMTLVPCDELGRHRRDAGNGLTADAQ